MENQLRNNNSGIQCGSSGYHSLNNALAHHHHHLNNDSYSDGNVRFQIYFKINTYLQELLFKLQQMPDIVSNVQTLSLDHSKNYEDDRSAIKIETANFISNDCNENYSQQNNNYQFDPIMSKQQQQPSTVDMSAIDPIIINYQLLSMHQKQNSMTLNGNAETDSILNDIDMLSS